MYLKYFHRIKIFKFLKSPAGFELRTCMYIKVVSLLTHCARCFLITLKKFTCVYKIVLNLFFISMNGTPQHRSVLHQLKVRHHQEITKIFKFDTKSEHFIKTIHTKSMSLLFTEKWWRSNYFTKYNVLLFHILYLIWILTFENVPCSIVNKPGQMGGGGEIW